MFEFKVIEREKDENSLKNRTALFRKIIESAADIVDDAEIKVSSKGVSIQFMDAMNVAMMDVFLKDSTFDDYRCDRELTLGLKMKEFLKILKLIRADANTTFHMHCDDDPVTLNITFDNEAYTSDYSIKLQNIGSECYDIPTINFTAEAEMHCSDFLDIRKLVGNFSEYVLLNACDSNITFSQKGDLTGSNTRFKAPEAGKYNIKLNVTDDVKVEIPMKYMNCVTKTALYCDNVKMCLGTNAPVFFEFKIGDFGHINYYIAPKLADE